MMKRNPAIEIYRVFLMLGIVTYHQFLYVGLGHHVVPRLCTSCVVGFVFITGFYGMRFSLLKLIRLYGIALFCASCFGVSVILAGGGLYGGIVEAISRLRSWWFVNAYIMLMLMAPLINRALTTCENDRGILSVSLPVIVLDFGWEFLAGVPGVKNIIPADRGFGTHTGLTLIGIYVAARIYRLLDVERFLPSQGWLALWIVSGICCACNLGKYNSSFALFFVMSSFTLMKLFGESDYYRFFEPVGSVCRFLAPSIFSVYLLHNGGAIPLLWGYLTTELMNEWLLSVGLSVNQGLWLIIFIVFLVCVGIDLVRRVALRRIKVLQIKSERSC